MGVVERHVKDAIQTALDGGLGSVQHVYDSGKYFDKFILNTDVHNHIYKQLQSLAETAVHNYFTNNRADMMELVGKVVDKQMEYHITNEVNRRMKNAVVELQKKLGA
jgi:ABC-type Fe3+-hydroxamate transport system substrate-binding protein